MSNSVGVLKVVVVQGKRLVIRDFKSSDPYVILKLGNQIAKTKVINSCLNPVWNEEIVFSLTEPVGTLNLVSACQVLLRSVESDRVLKSDEVFDKDRFKADDKMGHAHLNIQPLVSAARLKQALKDVWLRLCGVESGEIELKLKLVNPDLVPVSS
ncbi:hypothetical protein Cgig2_005383 [Carnegiea gigantea]|uniref:C2 domain-containing protein n=1 Tax=Carnegiea gigantea TaxID=171969 RepID=A0A9Q1K6N7_9CARY|nr:hypothetical protein Cgig2_005383 [Carnegiea gigantea]